MQPRVLGNRKDSVQRRSWADGGRGPTSRSAGASRSWGGGNTLPRRDPVSVQKQAPFPFLAWRPVKAPSPFRPPGSVWAEQQRLGRQSVLRLHPYLSVCEADCPTAIQRSGTSSLPKFCVWRSVLHPAWCMVSSGSVT